MARSALIASALVVVSLLVSPTPTESAEQRDVVSQDLKLLRAPGVDGEFYIEKLESFGI